ncbi:restriction endonuclease subunit S [Streptomyces sp. NPDC088925]|uniref:restriction endonuclease subunit S n=1 Tax=Streptomyces sp. NPDC088925 TaxID=3365914 RepID=UPI0037FE6912
MAEWRYVEYQELAAQERSSFAMGPFGSKITKENYKTSGVPVVRGVNLARGIFLDDQFVFISNEKADEIASANVRPGDLIFTHRGTIGQVSMIPRKPRFERYVIGSSQVKTRLNEKLARPEFYYYWFQSDKGQSSILANTSTVGVPGIATPLTSIRKLLVPLPPREEQVALVDVLSALDDKIAVNERVAVAAENLSRALFSGDSLQARTTVGQIAILRKDQVAPEVLPSELVAHYSLPAFDKGAMPDVTNPRSIRSGKFLINGNSVLLSKLNPGTPRVWNVAPDPRIPALASTEFLVLEPQAGVTTAELWTALSQPQFQSTLAAKVTGTSKSHQRVRPQEVMASTILDPRQLGPERKQVQTLADRAHRARLESHTLTALRDALLPQLMSGKIRVSEAEKIVKDAV